VIGKRQDPLVAIRAFGKMTKTPEIRPLFSFFPNALMEDENGDLSSWQANPLRSGFKTPGEWGALAP
jgi:hypothetical protein